ncbi:hypothetical protein BST61_g11078 [Cercospora zeina]
MPESAHRDQTQRSSGYTTMIDNGKFEWCPRGTAQASSAAATEGPYSRRSQFDDARNSAKYDAPTSLYGVGAQFETSLGRKT